MKKLLVVLLALIFLAVPAFAAQTEINLTIDEAGTASGTSSFELDIGGTAAFGKMADSATGTADYILVMRDLIKSPCWSVQVRTATTTGGSSSFDLGYKVINDEPAAAAWSISPLRRIQKNVATSASGYAPAYFQPPVGKYMRFYWTHDPVSGTTPFNAVTARVIVTEEGNCSEPELVNLGATESLTLNTSGVSSFAEPADAKEAWVNLIGGPFRVTDSSVSGVSNVGQKYYDGDSLFFYGKDDIDKARIMLDSTASSGSAYVIYYGRP